jgi:hypothetical protein
VHDIVDFEGRGIPGVFVATVEFDTAAAAQAAALGLDPARVLVPHPIQDRTDAEMEEMAGVAVSEIVAALTDQRH